jgi:hypothetical protein
VRRGTQKLLALQPTTIIPTRKWLLARTSIGAQQQLLTLRNVRRARPVAIVGLVFSAAIRSRVQTTVNRQMIRKTATGAIAAAGTAGVLLGVTIDTTIIYPMRESILVNGIDYSRYMFGPALPLDCGDDHRDISPDEVPIDVRFCPASRAICAWAADVEHG